MTDALAQAKQRLTPFFETPEPLNLDPIVADPWVVSSLLQKSIRRGETEIAQRAAYTLFALKGAAIWRRYMVIAFEDIGAGSVDALTLTVAAGTDSAWRKQCGGDAHVAVTLARILAEAPKDRSADYLICGVKDHPSLSRERLAIATASIEDRLSIMRDMALTLPHREMAAWYASGVEWRGEKQVGKGDLPALLNAFRELGAPEDLVTATGIAIARTREPITVMVPLIWLAANDGQTISVRDLQVPPLAMAGGLPLYALDKHTRLGQEAIWRFARENDSVRACLEFYVKASRRRAAAYIAAFYVDAAPVSRRLIWDQSESLEAFGIERDLLNTGSQPEGIAPILQTMRVNLPHLNNIRAELFTRSGAGMVPRPLPSREVSA